MRRLNIAVVIIVVAILVHLDWHLGRPGHTHDRSFDLPWHWVVAGIAFALFGWLIGKQSDPRVARSALLAVIAGLFVGQIIEPLGEMAAYSMTWAAVMPMIRWTIFAQFAAAAAAAGCAAFFLARRGARRQQ